MRQYPESNPRHHTIRIKHMVCENIEHLREGETKVREPKAQAPFETTAEVLEGLVTACDHYEQREPAWR